MHALFLGVACAAFVTMPDGFVPVAIACFGLGLSPGPRTVLRFKVNMHTEADGFSNRGLQTYTSNTEGTQLLLRPKLTS